MTYTKDETLVFQYRAISKSDDNHTIENLALKQLYFSDPATFKDPDDCKVWLDESGTEDQWANLIMINRKARIVDCTQAEAKQLLTDYLERGYFTKDGDIYTLVRNERYDKERARNGYRGDLTASPRVCCFSNTCSSVSMWEEHADNHRGICLCYSPIKSTNTNYMHISTSLGTSRIESELYNVYYVLASSLKDKINIFDEQAARKICKRLRTKADDYQYEREYRIIHFENELKNDILNYWEGDLKRIIFGLGIDPEDAELVYETVKNHYPPNTVNFYRSIGTIEDRVIIDHNPISNIDEYIRNLV
ncbi:hypothetical protein ASJ81_06010 [Methanosarcina spelaei]|uniref:DUF2971 domain-containing protein n=1 Tax=Methanosarcina spelaei TaxID=1036679 RepID=A0A2A2HTB2_9EURY|nr:DUF2971 domain-containing protein [Methanosarcina spelaei]PAV12545.1 hypothetical protein ASJ81_06010 [Methanosarcina spelaei]